MACEVYVHDTHVYTRMEGDASRQGLLSAVRSTCSSDWLSMLLPIAVPLEAIEECITHEFIA